MRKRNHKQYSTFFSSKIVIGSLNIQGGFCQKARSDDFNTMVQKCDIFGLQETYLEEQDSIHFSDYECFRSERKKKEMANRNSGGVLLLFKKVILPGLEKQQSANKHFIWVKMKKDFFKLETDIFICCAYIPPRDSNYFVEGDNDLLDILETDIEKYSNFEQIIVIGDLNSRLGKKV